jgi:uncharacterized protein YndB with AHSA1/START domain
MSTRSDSVPGTSPRVVISRVFNAPCAMVFRAWTDPKQMVQWWSPEEIECRSVDADVRIGGAYRIHMVDGEVNHIAIGKYLEIIPNKRVRFSWEWEHYPMPHSTVTVEFEDLGKTTRLTLIHDGLPDRDDVPDHKSGWTSALDKFGRMIANNEIKF